MQPLSEWTTDELRGELYDCGFQFDAALAELLRRERERCAAVCDDVKAANCESDTHGAELAADCLSRASVVIRGLQ